MRTPYTVQSRLLQRTAQLILVLVVTGCERDAANNNDGAQTQDAARVADKRTPIASVPTQPAAGPTAQPALNSTQPATSQEAAARRRFSAYYFHRTLRCTTCLSIERQAREAIELGYSGELSAGRLAWQAVNIEEPGNEHFEKDFELQTQSLVLVELTDERVARWRILPKVWELVEDPYGFQEYVVAEVALFIAGG